MNTILKYKRFYLYLVPQATQKNTKGFLNELPSNWDCYTMGILKELLPDEYIFEKKKG